jgi:hypothetical protein
MKASVFVHASCVPLTAAIVTKHTELRHGLVGQSQVPPIDASLLRSIARSLGILIVVFAESNGRQEESTARTAAETRLCPCDLVAISPGRCSVLLRRTGLLGRLLTGLIKSTDQMVEMKRLGAVTRYAGP